MNPNTSDLAAVIPTYETITIDGVDVVIRQIKVGMLPAVLLAVQPISHMLMQKDKPVDLQSMFMLYADDSLSLLAALSGKPRTWVDVLEIDDSIRLFTALLGVNLDFFVLRVLPLLPEVMAHLRNSMESLTAKAGQTASNP